MAKQPHIENVSFLRAGTGVDVFGVTRSSRLWRAVNECYVITVARTGLGSWRYRQRQRQTGEGWLMLMEPGEVHVTLEVRHPADFDAIRVDPSVMHGIFLSLLETESVHFGRADIWHPQLHAGWRRWLADVRAGAPSELVAAEFRRQLVQLLQVVAETGRQRQLVEAPPAVIRAQQLLRDVAAKRTMADVAAEVQKTPNYLSHRFRRHYGVCPQRYQELARVGAAKQLLLRGPTGELRTLAAVSQAVGFCDQSHMARAFKAHLGAQPRRLAQAAGW